MSDRPEPAERAKLSLATDAASTRQRVQALERIMEQLFVIPGTQRGVGLDAILSLVPVAGTTTGAVLGAYLTWEARNLGMSKWQLARMLGNVGTDWLLGLIPVVGAVPDFFFRSNTRNLRIVKQHLDKHHPQGAVLDVEARRL